MWGSITQTLSNVVLIAAFLVSTAAPSLAGSIVATVPLPGNSNVAVDVNPTTNRIYTSGGASGGQTITVIDGNTNTILSQGTLTGSYAHVNPTTNRFYAGQLSPSSILVYDGATNSLLTGISVSGCAIEAVTDPSNNRVYGAAQCGGGNDPVFIIDGATNTLLQTVGSGGVMGSIIVNPATHNIYLNASGVTKKVDPVTYAVTATPLAVQAVNPVTNRLYVWATNATQVLDGATESVIATLPASGLVGVDTTRNHIYITDSATPAIKIFDGATNTLIDTLSLPAGTSPSAIAVNSTTAMIYLISGTNLLVIKPSDHYGAWTTKASLPAARFGAAGAVIDGILYVAGGHDGSTDTPTLQAYHPATDTWSALAAMPAGRYSGNGAGVIGGKLYVAGGWTTSPGLPHGNLYVYDPAANAWAEKAALPNSRLSACGATGVINGKLYMTTACNGYNGYTNFLDVYDPAANAWSSLAPSAHTHASPAWGVIDNKFYVAGGIDNNSVSAVLEVYDPATNTWTTKASMPVAGQAFASGVINGKLYVTGGNDGASTTFNALHVYDPASDTWTTEGTPMPTPRSSPAFGVFNDTLYVAGGGNATANQLGTLEAYSAVGGTAPKSRILVAGGYTATGVAPPTAEVYDEATGTWSATANTIAYGTIPTNGICSANMALLGNGKVLIAGGGCGGDDGTTTNAASLYDPDTNQWSAAASMAYGRGAFGLVSLADGSALAIGGCAGGCSGPNVLGQYIFTVGKSAEIYEVSSNRWTTVANLNTRRGGLGNATTYQIPVALQDGRVLVCGGNDGFSTVYSSCEIYNPTSNTWTTTASACPENGGWYNSLLLQNGKVLVVRIGSQAADLFDPATQTWSATGAPVSMQPWGHLTRLSNGEVLLSGGHVSSGGTTTALATAQIYSPATGQWRATGSMGTPRTDHVAVLLSNGKVLAAGGYTGSTTSSWGEPLATAELFDPATGTWSPTGTMSQTRALADAIALRQAQTVITYGLTVTKSGTGSGAVATDTGALVWTGNTGTAPYAAGQSVTLTATPDAGATFAGWSGDCSGTGACTLNMLGNRNATATFNLIPVDTDPPTNASILINSGAAETGSQLATLTLSATDPSGMGQMRFSNDNTTWSDPVAYANTAVWTLSAGNGTKTVYAKFSDSRGNWMTAPVSDTITLNVTVVPQTPTGLEVYEFTNDAVTLRWPKNAESGVVYDVYRSETPDGLYYKINTNPIGDLDIAHGYVYFTDKGLSEGTTYYYKVRAILSGVASAGLSGAASESTLVVDDYTVGLADSANIVNRGGTVKYYIQLQPKENFKGTINLACSGLAAENFTYDFSINRQSLGSSVSGLTLPAAVTLTVAARSAAQLKEHAFELLAQNVWTGGASDQRATPLTLLVIDTNASGIHAEVEKSVFRKGEKVKLYGSILPALAGKTVTLTLTRGSDVQTKTVVTALLGKFQDADWLSTLGIGTYSITASWVDDNSNTRTSIARTFTVEKGAPVLTCLRLTGEIPALNTDFTIQGSMNPGIVGAPMTLRLYAPDGTFTDRDIGGLDEEGEYRIMDRFFDRKGIWKFKTYYLGDDQYIGAESDLLVVPVEIEAGRAIILGGGVAAPTNSYWKATKILIENAYKNFKKKGFADEMIWLMINAPGIDINYDLNDEKVVDLDPPTPALFLDAIRHHYAAQLDADTPLFIYMFGHGTADGRFRVLGDDPDDYVSAAQMKLALDDLQAATGCPVVVIVESCYSGTFITGLASTNGYKRIVLTSIDSLHEYRIDDTGLNTFSTFLFSSLIDGNHFFKAFDDARSQRVLLRFPPPQMDDGQSGVLAANTFLRGDLTMGLKPIISEIVLPVVLEGASSTPISISVIRGDVSLDKVWIQVMAPGTVLTDQEGTLSYPQFQPSCNLETGKCEGSIDNLNTPGIYTIIVYAQDVNHEVSDPGIAYITVQGVGLPGDIDGDGAVTLADAILALQYAAGITPAAGAIQTGYTPTAGDVNSDGKIGIREAIYILQAVAGVR